MNAHRSIGESLSVLAQVAGIPLAGLDDDQLDIVALRLVIEPGDQPVLTRIGRIVGEVRYAEVAAGQRVERERAARRKLIRSHTAEDARTGIYLVPRRPEVDPLTVPTRPTWEPST
jgi:hypothetical protein